MRVGACMCVSKDAPVCVCVYVYVCVCHTLTRSPGTQLPQSRRLVVLIRNAILPRCLWPIRRVPLTQQRRPDHVRTPHSQDLTRHVVPRARREPRAPLVQGNCAGEGGLVGFGVGCGAVSRQQPFLPTNVAVCAFERVLGDLTVLPEVLLCV